MKNDIKSEQLIECLELLLDDAERTAKELIYSGSGSSKASSSL